MSATGKSSATACRVVPNWYGRAMPSDSMDVTIWKSLSTDATTEGVTMHHMILGWFEHMIRLHGLAWAMAHLPR